MAEIQEKLFEDKTFEENKNKVINLVKQWSKDAVVVEFDYKDIYTDKIKTLQKKIWNAYEIDINEDNKYSEYIWGTLEMMECSFL